MMNSLSNREPPASRNEAEYLFKGLSSYDAVPYESVAFSQTHPDHLAVLGRLFGMRPAPVTRCRVLELGCASGGNLIPMAYNLPDSVFVGVDFSARQVAEGRRMINDLNLTNIRIEPISIMDIDASWGQFDYIITHGVYSWVPEAIREKILNVSAANLSPQGIAYVSYNTYPGWHMREMIRHMMLYHANQFDDHQERIEQARALMDFLAGAVSTEHNPFGLLLEKEIRLIKNVNDSYLFHEHLEDVNTPVYFHQFMERAKRHGLQYLGEADVAAMLTSGFPSEVSETLDRISRNIINKEQYMDFLHNRFFRQTLLCHQGIELRRELGPQHISDMRVASNAQPKEAPIDLAPDTIQAFETLGGSVVESHFPMTKAAMAVLARQWPQALTIADLFAKALHMLGDSLECDLQKAKEQLMTDIFHCYIANAMELHTWQAEFVVEVRERPRSSPLARYLLANQKAPVNQRHEVTKMSAVASQLVPVMDGSRDRSALIEILIQCVQDGNLVVEQDEAVITDKEAQRSALGKALDQSLENLKSSAMLVE